MMTTSFFNLFHFFLNHPIQGHKGLEPMELSWGDRCSEPWISCKHGLKNIWQIIAF